MLSQRYHTHLITAQDVVSNKTILCNSFGNIVFPFGFTILVVVWLSG